MTVAVDIVNDIIVVRYHQNEPRVVKILMIPDLHPLIGRVCPGCGKGIQGRTRVALVYVGPGDDTVQRQRSRKGQWHNGTAVAMHERCAK